MNSEKYLLPCFNKKLFGVDCPGCGTQRALVQITEGNFTEAFHLFPAIYTTILFFGVLALHFLDKSRNYSKIVIALAVINAVIIISSYLYKMLPYLNL